jgi:hypothetical protein
VGSDAGSGIVRQFPTPATAAIHVLPRLVYLALCRSVKFLALLTRGDAAKDLEILVLRHQLTVLQRQTCRPKLEPADRALLAAISRVLPRERWSCFFVTPRRCSAGIAAWSWADGPIRVAAKGGHHWTMACSS